MDRRRFLTWAGVSAGALVPGFASGAGSAGTGKTLVVIFQRGGCDGLNLVVPHAEDDYYSLRPTIAIPRPGRTGGALDLDGLFGLHPRLAALRSLYDAGDLAILPAVHYAGAQRSHFEGQDLLEVALGDRNSGWLGRFLGSSTPASPRALNLDNEVPLSLAGTPRVFSVNANANIEQLPTETDDPYVNAMARLYDASAGTNPALHRVVSDGRTLWGAMGLLSRLGADSSPANGAVYPATPFGSRMRRAAHAIKLRTGLEIITVNSNGWDTHSAQGGASGRQAVAIGELGDGIAAFWQDLGSDGEDVLVMTMTEFGRTAAENGSYGTDHGNAAAWLVSGPSVQGGIHTGTGGWPGLEPLSLHEGRDLAYTIDFRDVMAEVLTRHLLVADPTSIIPGHVPQAVGFLPG